MKILQEDKGFTGVPKVNFFLVGAPKCGTTAMAYYLSKHPNICMSLPKEPFFFCNDFENLRDRIGIRTLDDYHSCFSHYNQENHLVLGEASVWYLYSKVAISNLLEYNPEAKILVMVRNPVTMIHSLHSMRVGLGHEPEENLGRAFALEKQRESDPGMQLRMYSKIGMLGEQLQNLYSLVPERQVKVIVYDDFRLNSPQATFEILDFLGLDSSLLNDLKFDRLNSQKVVHSKLFLSIYKNQALRKVASFVKEAMRIKSLGIGIAKLPISMQDKRRMIDIFSEDVELLSSLLNRDLRYWLEL